MTDTNPDLIERAQEISPRRRRGMWLWVLVVVAGVLAAVLLWPDGDETPVLSESPPYGLTTIDMPRTKDELVAVLERMSAIDGRQPTVTREGDLATVVYQGTELPEGYWSIWVILDVEVEPEWFIDGYRQEIADAEEQGRIVEASALDPSGDLVWVADHTAEGGIPAFRMMWADPSDLGPAYFVMGDTADFRLKLVHAFIRAVGD